MSISLAQWVALLRSEYLEDFVASGGAAVKIAVIPVEQRSAAMDAVAAEAAAAGCLVARVDAAQTKVHMVDHLFHEVARQVDWDALADRWLRERLRDNGIYVAGEQPLHDMDAIAQANGRLKPQLFGEINRLIEHGVQMDYAMCKEFRTAMTMLCLGHVNPQNVSPTDAEVIKQWLVGEKCNLPALKRLQIYQRVGRHNARLLLGALAVWARRTGYAGLAVLLDLNAVVSEEGAASNPVRYTRSTVLDTYEVLRQCIDDTDEVSHLLVVAVSGPGLIDPQNVRRNVDNYTALKMRIVDDVHDRNRANPLNTLARLEEKAVEEVADAR